MSGHPVLQSPFDYRVWKSLERRAFSKGGPSALAAEVAAYGGTVNSQVLVMLIDALEEEGIAGRDTLRDVVSRSRAVDCMPSVRASQVLLEAGDLDGAEEMLSMSAGSQEMSMRSLAEARIRMARGDREGAAAAAKVAYGNGPEAPGPYEILAETDPQGGWPVRRNIQDVMHGVKPTNPPGEGRLQELYSIYRDWFSGRRESATQALIASRWYKERDPEFLLASARMSMDEKDWHSASMVYTELAKDGAEPFVFVEASEAAIGMGDPARALDLLSRADGHSRRVLRDVVRARTLAGDRTEMMNAVRAQLDSELSDAEDHVRMVRFLLQRGMDHEAESILNRYSMYVGDDSVTLTMRSIMLMRSGDYPAARAAASRAVRKDDESNTARAQLARVLYLMDRPDAAERECDRILAADPGNADALSLMRDLHMGTGDHAKAAEACGALLEANPSDLSTRTALAVATCGQGDRQRAGDIFISILRDDGSRERSIAVMSSMLSCGMDREAASLGDALCRQYPRDPMLRRLRGNAEYAIGEYLKASVTFAEAAAMDPHDPVLWHSKGMADEARGDLESAEAAYAKALLLDQGEPGFWISRSVVQERTGDRYGAVESLNRALELDPRCTEALVRKARVLESAGRSREALYFIRQAGVAMPGDVRIMDLESEMLASCNDNEAAAAVLRERMAKEPSERAAVRLARILVSRGDREGAVASLNEAIAKMPDSEVLKKERERVASGAAAAKEEAAEPVKERPKEDVSALMAMSVSLMEAGDLKGAMRMADRALAVAPDDPDVNAQKARVVLATGDAEGAGFLAENSLRRNPGNPTLRLVLALAKEAKGDQRGALSEVDRAISDGLDTAEVHRVKGRILAAMGQAGMAAASYARVVTLDPDDYDTAEALAKQYMAAGNLSGATGTVSRLLRREPGRFSAILLKAEIARERGDRDGVVSAFRMMSDRGDAPDEYRVPMVRILEDMGLRDEARELMGGPKAGFSDAVKRYAEKALRRAYTTRTSYDDPDILDALGLDERTASEVSRYLSDMPDPGPMGRSNPQFQTLEPKSHDVILKLSWTDLEGQPLLPLEKVFVAGGFRDADSAKILVAYVHKAMFSPAAEDDGKLSKIAMGLPKGMTVYEIISQCGLGVYEAAAVKSMIVRSVVAHLGLHELAHEAGGVVPLGKGEAHRVRIVPERRAQVADGAEHLAAAALRRALGEPRDDEVLGPEPLALRHGALDLPRLALGERVLGAVQRYRHERAPGADLPRNEVYVPRVREHRLLVARGAVSRHGDDHVALDRPVQGEPAGHPLAEHLVEQVRLVGVDEHHLEVRRERGYRVPPVTSSGERLSHDPLEGHAVRHPGRGVGPVGASLEGPPELLELRVLLRRRVGDVSPDGALDVPADEPLAHEMGHRSDRSEPLDAEVVGEPPGAPDRVHVLRDDLADPVHGHGAVPDGDLERVADEVAELDGAAPGVDAGYLDVLQIEPEKVLGRAPERHQLGGDRPLVLGAGEADPGPGHP